MSKLKDLTASVFHQLTVISREPNDKNGSARWLCVCSCGIHKSIPARRLVSEETKSCGCYLIAKSSTQQGGSKNIAYNSWKGMVARCHNTKNKDYCRYGALGITVYEEWINSFQAFITHIGPKPTAKHSVDRFDNTVGYVPGNVRWATATEQQANRKCTVKVLYQGRLQPLSVLATKHGKDHCLVYTRVIKYGWSVEDALTRPLRKDLHRLNNVRECES
jgi:hypothetical protein